MFTFQGGNWKNVHTYSGKTIKEKVTNHSIECPSSKPGHRAQENLSALKRLMTSKAKYK